MAKGAADDAGSGARDRELARLREELDRTKQALGKRSAQLHDTRAELADVHHRHVALFDFAPFPYVILDAQGAILEINVTGARFLRIERRRAPGLPLTSWVALGQRRRFLDHMRGCRRGGGGVKTEVEMFTRQGEPLGPVEIHSSPPEPSERGPTFRTVLTSLAERREREREVHELAAQRQTAELSSQAKDRFLALLSHELRTPLTPVLAAVSDLEAREGLDPDVRDLVTVIRRNVQDEAHLVDELLDASRVRHGRLAVREDPVNVHTILEEVAQWLGRQGARLNLRTAVVFKAEQVYVRGDALRLRQVLRNLVDNALKFTDPGGRVEIRTDNRGSQLVILVSDTGQGMERERLLRLFEPFEQVGADPEAKPGGLGLGLAICKGLVEAHQGTIDVKSEGRGRGTTFEIVLPTIEPPEESAPPPVAASDRRPVPEPGTRVLLVEDHSDTADLLSMLLRKAGYTVCGADRVASAIELLAEEDVDVVLSDLGLPDGSGLDLLRHLRAQGQDVPAVALSGYGARKDVEAAERAGFQAHVTKPVSFDRLRRTLEAVRTAPPV